MIIGIDASRANSAQRTGTEWYSFFLIRELARIIPSEHTVFLYTKEPLLPDLAHGLPQHFVPRVLTWKFGFLWTQFRLSWEMLFSAPDLLFVPAHTIPLWSPKKTVVTLHDIGFERLQELYNTRAIGEKVSWKKRFLSLAVRVFTFGHYRNNELDYHRFAARYCVKHAAHILTVSDFSQQEIQDFFHVPSEKITRVYNGFDQDFFWGKTKEGVSRSFAPLAKPYVLFIGRLEQKKNIPRFLEAWNILKHTYHMPHTLVLAGTPGFQYERIRERIASFGIQDSVQETGYLPEAHLPQVLKEADLLVLPSLYEGFGIPILEAFATETPVVCSDIPALREVAGEAALYFDPLSPQDMADKIFQALGASPRILQHRRKLGHDRLQYFSWKQTARQTWRVLDSVLHSS